MEGCEVKLVGEEGSRFEGGRKHENRGAMWHIFGMISHTDEIPLETFAQT